MPVMMCFGDSNTHGTRPMDGITELPRMAPDVRWPGVARAALGPDWTLIEEGLPGRTTCRPDPVMGPHMDGRIGLVMALASHKPIDLMTLMLGTNDLKARFEVLPDQLAADLGMLLDICYADEFQSAHDGFEVLLIAPPPPFEAGPFTEEFAGAAEKSRGLTDLIRAQAEARDVAFLAAGDHIACSPMDGIHFDEAAHGKLGAVVAQAIRDQII